MALVLNHNAMIEANIFVERASVADVNNAASLVLVLNDLGDDTIVDIAPKAGGVEMIVEFDRMLDYETFVYELEDAMGTPVSTFMY